MSCSCSKAFIAAAFPNAESRLPALKETIIDGYSLFLFKNYEDLKVFLLLSVFIFHCGNCCEFFFSFYFIFFGIYF